MSDDVLDISEQLRAVLSSITSLDKSKESEILRVQNNRLNSGNDSSTIMTIQNVSSNNDAAATRWPNLITDRVFNEKLTNITYEKDLLALQKKYKYRIDASSFASACLRRILLSYWCLNQYKPKVYNKSVLMSAIGTLLHSIVPTLLELDYRDIKVALQYAPNMTVRGEIDAIYTVPNGNVLVEIKTVDTSTITSRDFVGRNSDWYQLFFYLYCVQMFLNKINKPHPACTIQCTGKNGQPIQLMDSVYAVQIIYLSRDLRLNIMSYIVDSKNDDIVFRRYAERLEYLRKNIEANIIPALSNVPEVNFSTDCFFCPYDGFCKSHTQSVPINDSEYKVYFNP